MKSKPFGAPSSVLFGWACALLALAMCGSLFAQTDEVSRTPPAIYAEKLAPLLTPLDKVLKSRDVFTSSDGTGAVLLEEEVVYVDEAGRVYNVDHSIYQALTEEGCKEVANETHDFRRSDQKIHLVLARTILPDGTKIDVQPNAALIKTPQDRENVSLYDDGAELLIMFPSINKGAVTESIVITEQDQGRIPGEFSRRFLWRAGWPRVETRRIVELPDDLAKRLKIETLGEGVPEPSESAPAVGRKRLTWTKGKQPEGNWEENMPPSFQVGPYTWMTTIPDWDGVARWYAGLLAGRETLDPELTAQVDEWTKDAKTPREVIEILHEKVAREVRYVGLEFGISGFQPADCNAVWGNRYGDCKDKANLLRAMLKHKGITSKLVLVETAHAGVVEKRVPDYRQFDHVILTAEYEPGKWIYCDPTVRYGSAGVLPPSDADRDVLVLDGDKHRWARTPSADAGKIAYRFDLEMSPSGEMTGWITCDVAGYYAAGYHEEFLGKDRRDTIRLIADYVQDFYPAAQVMDAETKLAEGKVANFQFRAYVVIPSPGEDGQTTVQVPFSNGLVPDVGDDASRFSSFFVWRDRVEVTLALTLPPGVKARNLPSPYHLSAPSLDAEASWRAESGHVGCEIRLDLKKEVVKPAEYPVFRNSLRSLLAWIERPLTLDSTDMASPAPQETASGDAVLENFPIMPTAIGQRNLLEKRFPSDGDTSLRRKALVKIQQYFPSDKETQFYAAANLVLLDEEKNKAAALPALKKVIETYRGSVDGGWLSWAEYRLAFLEMDAGSKEAARKLFLQVARNESSTDYRRAWSCYHAANIGPKSPPDEAIALLREGVGYDTEALTEQLPLFADLLIQQKNLAALREPLGQVAARKSEESAAGLVALAKFAGTLPQESGQALLAEIEASGGGDAENVADAIKTAKAKATWMAVWKELQGKLKDYLAAHPRTGIASPGGSAEAVQKEVDKAIEAKKPERSLDLTLELLTRFSPTEKFPELLWLASARAEWIEKVGGSGSAGPILPFLLDLCAQIPKNNENYFEGQVVKGRVLNRAGKYADAEACLAAALAEPEFPEAFETSVRRELGEALEAQGKLEEALRVYRALEPRIGEFASISDVVLRAVFLELHFGRQAEAIALLGKLGSVPPKIAKKADYAFQIANMSRLAGAPGEAEKYWTAAGSWQKPWEELSARLSPNGKPARLVVVPVIDDLNALWGRLGNAVRSRDKAELLEEWNLCISAARWDPGMALEAASMRDTVASLFTGTNEKVAGFISVMLEPVHLEGDFERRRNLNMAAALLDDGQSSQAMTLLRRVMSEESATDEINFTLRRLFGLAAGNMGEDRAAAIASLEDCLSIAPNSSSRAYTVRVLGKLLRLENRAADEEALLKRELDHPQVKAENIDDLRARYRALSEDKDAEKNFSKFLAAWWPKYRPAWFDLAAPATLADAKVPDVAAVLASPDTLLPPIESIKYLFLAAQDEKVPYLERLQAWDAAALKLIDLYSRQSEVNDLFSSNYDNPLLPDHMRSRWLWFAIYDAGTRHRAERFAKLLKNPLAKDFSDQQKVGIAAFEITSKVNFSSVPSTEEAFYSLGKAPLGLIALEQANVLFETVLRLGDLEAAQRMYEKFSRFSFTPDVQVSISASTLELLKKLKQARRFVPVQEALRAAVLRRFPDRDISRPDNYDDLRMRDDVDLLTVSNGEAIRRYRIQTKDIAPQDLNFWTIFIRGLDTRSELALRSELVKILIEQVPDDQTKAAGIVVAMPMLDLDEPSERKLFFSLCLPFRDRAKWPLSEKVIRYLDGRIALRTGDYARYEKEILKGADPKEQEEARMLSLQYYYLRNDPEKLKESLDAIPFDRLLAKGTIGTTLGALEVAGMEDEAELAREHGRKEVRELVVDSWVYPTREALSEVFELAEALKDPSLVPAAWMQAMEKTVKDPFVGLSLRIKIARLEKNWEEVEKLASEAIATYPTFYDFYWLKGEALYSRGHLKQALEPLRIYARYAQDERNQRKALEWIKEAESAATEARANP